MFDRLDDLLIRYEELMEELNNPYVVEDQKKFRKLMKEQADLAPIVEAYKNYKQAHQDVEDSVALLEEESDEEMRELAKEELADAKKRIEELEQELKILLLPKDPNDDKNVMVEIRAGAGGDEAALFASELYRMYVRYAERQRWKTEIVSLNENGIGGFKEVVAMVTGKGAYSINPAYTISMDVSDFDICNNDLTNAQGNEAELYQRLIQLYRGKFLSEIKGDHNILSKSAYYHSIYIGRVIEYANLLEENKEYAEMERLARNAIEIDDLEEDLYEILIRALYFQKQYKKAYEVYRSTTELLYEALGIKPSKSLQDLHNLIKKEIHEENVDILEVQQELIEEEEEKNGAFFCEYGTFKEMYVIQSRTIGRLGICV